MELNVQGKGLIGIGPIRSAKLSFAGSIPAVASNL